MIAQKNEQVERELEKLVSIIQEVIPSVNEIRVFGSYNNGNWNPEKSDVDVFVETADEDYSRYRNRREGNFQGESLESTRRIKLKERIKKRIRNMICVIESMKSGRLLYQNKQIPMTN